jgi:hypothetical protein
MIVALLRPSERTSKGFDNRTWQTIFFSNNSLIILHILKYAARMLTDLSM